MFIETVNRTGGSHVNNEKFSLENLVKNPVSLAAFLDSIALFEIVGSKWMLAVPFEYWDHEIHEHCSDEVRHTKLVQDAARHIRSQLNEKELIQEVAFNNKFYQQTEQYLNKLAKRVFKLTLSAGRNTGSFSLNAYSIMAFLIERRIMKIYPSVAKYSEIDNAKAIAKQIISDEKKHLHFVGERLPQEKSQINFDKKKLIEIEEDLAFEWLSALTEVLDGR